MIRKERIWEDMKQSRETRVEDEPRLNEQVVREDMIRYAVLRLCGYVYVGTTLRSGCARF